VHGVELIDGTARLAAMNLILHGISRKPTAPGWGISHIADAWAVLMDRLGYSTFGAQSGDWGSSISTCLAQQHPERVVGLHLTPPLAAPTGPPSPI
jgi:pimeloyl-ACP methyl ester carboxylesterase